MPSDGTTCRDHALADVYPRLGQPLPRWLLPLLAGPKLREELLGCDTPGEKSLLRNVATAVEVNFRRGSGWPVGKTARGNAEIAIRRSGGVKFARRSSQS